MKRKVLSLLLSALLFSCCGGCASASVSEDSANTGSTQNLAPIRELMEMNKYDLNAYLLPFWNTREIYQETAVFLEGETEAPLLYPAQDVFSVKNYGLNVVYEEGKDYTLTSDGKIKLTKDSSIPKFPVDEYYLTAPDEKAIKVNKDKVSLPLMGDRWLKFFAGNELTDKQISVCYRHKSEWKGPVPAGKSEKLSGFLSKLKAKQQVNVMFYGDSITTGAQSSGFEQISPKADIWPVMVQKYIEAQYGTKVGYFNGAVGGYSTNQGVQNFDSRVNAEKIDLLVLGFGMNDKNTSVETYKSSIRTMIEKFKENYPGGEVVLVSTMTPNYETDWYGNQVGFSEALLQLEEEYANCVCADVTGIFEFLFQAGKRFRDVTVNNVNHPNDFAARLYAQVVLKTVFGDSFYGENHG